MLLEKVLEKNRKRFGKELELFSRQFQNERDKKIALEIFLEIFCVGKFQHPVKETR